MTGTVHTIFPPEFPVPRPAAPEPALSLPVPMIYEDTEPERLPVRAYAAIQLRVPDSGIEWLDAMIRKSRDLDRRRALSVERLRRKRM